LHETIGNKCGGAASENEWAHAIGRKINGGLKWVYEIKRKKRNDLSIFA